LPAARRAGERRPLVILTNGYDATVTEMYFAAAVAVAARGYHCFFFDGPGQGELLIEQGIPMRPDWESVIRPVVDFALTLPNIDPKRIALSGWSLGGYLALRGASGEPRLAACIADPGLRAVLTPAQLSSLGVTVAHAGDPGTAIEAALGKLVEASPKMHWPLVQRGLWVHGVKSLGEYVAAATAMTLEGRVAGIRCPTLLTTAEDDRLSKGAEALMAELTCPKTLMMFTAAEGAA
jgi:alpha-beta hydrolase superfamily lysophospholipase